MFDVQFIIPGRIEGNGSIDYSKNPLGYHRSTQGSRWNFASTLYEKWKDYICSCFFQAYADQLWKFEDLLEIEEFYLDKKGSKRKKKQKLIRKSNRRFTIITWTFFKNNARCDSDNVHKGVKDSLFQNDKNCEGIDFYEVGYTEFPFIYCRLMDHDLFRKTFGDASSIIHSYILPDKEDLIKLSRLQFSGSCSF